VNLATTHNPHYLHSDRQRLCREPVSKWNNSTDGSDGWMDVIDVIDVTIEPFELNIIDGEHAHRDFFNCENKL
jgi:hypothetical protein